MSKSRNHIARNFYPGECWLYIKVYGGVTTCDQLLVDVVYPTIMGLKRSKVIDKWFFIRYSDPDFHLRIRVLLSGQEMMAKALNAFNRRLLPMCRSRLLHKVSIDTYERELERYGKITMDVTELLFDIDSHCICQLLKPLLHEGNGSERWRLAFVWVDLIMDVFGLDINQKWGLIKKMSDAYLKEFGFNEHNIKPLAKRYRHLSVTITQLMQGQSLDNASFHVIKENQNKIKKSVKSIDVEQLNLTSLLHMSMNRLFASQNRLNELVLYYCLERYYRKEVKKAQRFNSCN